MNDLDDPRSLLDATYYQPVEVFLLKDMYPMLDEAETRRKTMEKYEDYAGPSYRDDVLFIPDADGNGFRRRYDHPVKIDE